MKTKLLLLPPRKHHLRHPGHPKFKSYHHQNYQSTQSNSSCNPTSIAAPLPLLNTPHTSALYDLDDAVLRKKDTEESTTNKE